MFIWFAAASFLIVVMVFDSPAVDYRMVMLGAVAPVVEGVVGGPWVLHTLAGCVVVFAIVVVATWGRRLAARRAVGLPIGLLLHLVLDGTWLSSSLFWWPFGGGRPLGEGRIPEFDHLGSSLALEVVGVVIAIFLVRRFELAVPDRRRAFIRTGRLARDVMRR
ncbi:MAG TPA: hypothetical protein VM282_01140 [Acidimicrobiales bacterium]|nr:hypothetical protein [Acidimicrobiales bacterium]